MEGEYNIRAAPIEGKTWAMADKVEVVMTLEVGNEKRVFRGLASLSACMRGNNGRNHS